MNSTVFNRLVDSYEQQISSLFSRGVSLRLRLAAHDSGPRWIATPLLYDSFTHTPHRFIPDALSNLLGEAIEPL